MQQSHRLEQSSVAYNDQHFDDRMRSFPAALPAIDLIRKTHFPRIGAHKQQLEENNLENNSETEMNTKLNMAVYPSIDLKDINTRWNEFMDHSRNKKISSVVNASTVKAKKSITFDEIVICHEIPRVDDLIMEYYRFVQKGSECVVDEFSSSSDDSEATSDNSSSADSLGQEQASTKSLGASGSLRSPDSAILLECPALCEISTQIRSSSLETGDVIFNSETGTGISDLAKNVYISIPTTMPLRKPNDSLFTKTSEGAGHISSIPRRKFYYSGSGIQFPVENCDIMAEQEGSSFWTSLKRKAQKSKLISRGYL